MTVPFLGLALVLATARLLGECARRLRQPAVLGEIVGGVLLGPTVLGAFAPDVTARLFPSDGAATTFLEAFAALAAALFMFVAGLEVDLSRSVRRGRVALTVGAVGMLLPFAVAFVLALVAPLALGREPGADPLAFALFLGTAMSVSALPVVARTLIDLGIFRTDFAMVVVSAAILQDVAGWIVFAVLLGLAGGTGHALPVGATIGLTLSFAVVVLTVVRAAVDRVLPWVLARATWPGGVIGFAATLALAGAAATEALGVHAIFGAFLMGVALGDSAHLRERTRATLDDFVSFVFAPVFFASIGMSVDFAAAFDAGLVLAVLVLATATKVPATYLGARLGGIGRRQSAATACAMNARGAVEVVLGALALRAGIIGEPLFVALVVTAVLTSLGAGPLVTRILGLRHSRRFSEFVDRRAFVRPLVARTPGEALASLSRTAAAICGYDGSAIEAYLREREASRSTALGQGVALPHARLPGLDRPAVCVAVAPHGIEWESDDGERVRLVVLVLTPAGDDDVQLELIADVARTLQQPAVREQLVNASGHTEFLAAVRTAESR